MSPIDTGPEDTSRTARDLHGDRSLDGHRSLEGLRGLHRQALADASTVIAGVRAADLGRPTPCAGWDLQALLAHMIGQNHGFARAAETGDAPAAAYAPRVPDPRAVLADWQESADRVGAAFAHAPPDRTVVLVEVRGGMTFPMVTALGFHLLDTAVHAWDVASALGRVYRPADELVASVLDVALQVPDGASRTRPGAAFAPGRDLTDADPWARALALLGRLDPGEPPIGEVPTALSTPNFPSNWDQSAQNFPGSQGLVGRWVGQVCLGLSDAVMSGAAYVWRRRACRGHEWLGPV